MRYRLIGSIGDREVELGIDREPRILGAARSCDLRLVDSTVSRHHAEVRACEDGVEIVDIGSLNGVFIKRRRIDSAVARNGDEVRFGTVILRVERIGLEDSEVGLEIDGDEVEFVPSEGASVATEAHDPARIFLFDAVPNCLESLADSPDLGLAAQKLGHHLFDLLPVSEISIIHRGDEGEAVLFEARDSSRGSRPCSKVVAREGLEIHSVFFTSAAADRFASVIETAHGLLRLLGEIDVKPTRAAHEPPPVPAPATVSGGMRRLYDEAAQVAQSDIGVLITGESGTGKEILARFIHDASPRVAGPFVTINCAALPRDLLEAELFGIERGVATGVEKRAGRFELADGGTLFLDEIGDMALETQAMILRTLQEGEVFRIGASSPRRVSVRILAATNKDLAKLMADKHFREDLFFRLAAWKAHLPALRDRREDIANLAAFFLAREARRLGKRVRGISRAALEALLGYDWPGNIRQLENEMARVAAVIGGGGMLDSQRLGPEILAGPRIAGARTLGERLQAHERFEIFTALDRCGGDAPAAAELLGVPRSTLYRRMRKLGISRPSSSE